MLLLFIFSFLLFFSVFEICNTKEYRNNEEEKINKILQNYLEPLKQLTDNLPNHEIEIQLEIERPDDDKYAPQLPGRANKHVKHKNKESYAILQNPANQHHKHVSYHRPDNQKYALYDAPRKEHHKHSLHNPKSEHKKHLPHHNYKKLDYPRPDYQKPLPLNYEYPGPEFPKAPSLVSKNEYPLSGYQRLSELLPGHDHPRTDYHYQPNNENPRPDYQKSPDMTRYFELETPDHHKYIPMHMEYQRPDYPKRQEFDFQRQERDYHKYAPVQPYYETETYHDRHKYPSLQGKMVYVPYNDDRHMRRTNNEIGIKPVPQQVFLRIDEKETSTPLDSTVASTDTPAVSATSSPSPSTTQASLTASSKSPVYMEDLRDLLNEFANKLQSTTGAPHPSVIMTNAESLHGNLEDIVQLIKQGLQVAKRLKVPNADQLQWLQIKLPKNVNQ